MSSTEVMRPTTTKGAKTKQGGGSNTRLLILIGLGLAGLALLVSVVGPLVSPYSPTEIIGRPFEAPSAAAPLGTDGVGRDVLSRVLNGGLMLLALSFVSAAVGTALGALVGLTAGYFQGWYSNSVLTFMDVLFAFPSVVLALLFVSVGGPNPILIALAVALSHVPPVARVVWGSARTFRDKEFVMWSRSVGVRDSRIITRDLLPLVTSPVAVEFGLRMMWSIGAIAGLSFIGYGIQPPTADWGLMVNENRSALTLQPLSVVAPIVMIGVLTLGCYLASEGMARKLGRTGGKN